jgi:hypothetical protein
MQYNFWMPGIDKSMRTFQLNAPELMRLCKTYAHNKGVHLNSTEMAVDDGILSPEYKTIKTDWKKVDEYTGKTSAAFFQRLLATCYESATRGEKEIAKLRDAALALGNANSELDRVVTKQSLAALEKKIGRADTAVKILTAVRNTSAEFILVASTGGLSGGAAVAGAAGGALMKGGFKYQDTGSLGAATIEAASSFALAKIPIGAGSKGLTSAEKFVVLVFMEVPVTVASQTAMAHISGEKPGKELIKSFSQMGVESVGEALFKNSRVGMGLVALANGLIESIPGDTSGSTAPANVQPTATYGQQALVDMRQFCSDSGPIDSQPWKFDVCRRDTSAVNYVRNFILRL